MADYILSAQQIQSNWKLFRDIVNEISPSRKDAMNKMYDELEERTVLAPASSFDYFHNAIPGGYVDHILRVYDFGIKVYDLWKDCGLITDNFTLEELSFAITKHDLGKLGMPGDNRELYQTNKSEWHRKNQGKIYQMNPDLSYMENTARTFYLLNHYRIPYTENEQIGIQLTDGLYNEANKPYLVSYDVDRKQKANIGTILHHADIMAARFEFEKWGITTGKFNFYKGSPAPKLSQTAPKTSEMPKSSSLDLFDKMFPPK